ncbi:hypothetical protein D3C78_470440 [compost metagenome]
MTDKPRLKTIGITEPVWRNLKLLALQEDCTLSEVIERLIEQTKQKRSADSGKPRNRPA